MTSNSFSRKLEFINMKRLFCNSLLLYKRNGTSYTCLMSALIPASRISSFHLFISQMFTGTFLSDHWFVGLQITKLSQEKGN